MPEKPIPQSTQSEPPSISNCPYGPVKCRDCGEEQYPTHFENPYTQNVSWYSAANLCDKCEKIIAEKRSLEELYGYAGLDARHKTMIFESFKLLSKHTRESWEFLEGY